MTRACGTDGRAGFALVELLAVIAIFTLLIGLLMPAVQVARESARRAECADHLRQISLAALGYHETHGCFPPGYIGPRPQAFFPPYRGQAVGCLAFLLPYLEVTEIGRRIDEDRQDHGNMSLFDLRREGDPYWLRPTAWHMAQARIAMFVCPSDAPYAVPNPAGFLDYTCPFDTKLGLDFRWQAIWFDPGVGNSLGRTNYMGVAGITGFRLPNQTYETLWTEPGIFTNRSQTDYRHITDGASQTLLFGEVMGGRPGCYNDWPGDCRASPQSYAWIGCGAMPTLSGLQGFFEPGENMWMFTSHHRGVVQFSLADGAVRSIKRDIDFDAFLYLSTIDEGIQANVPP